MSTLKEILESTRQLIATKTAEFDSNLDGSEKAAKGLDTSGAGDDSKLTRGHALEADEAALEPTKKPLDSADAMAEPPSDGSGTTGAAAGQSEGNVTDRSELLGSEDAALEPTKEPLDSADANAEPSSGGSGTAKLANEILADIRGAQSKVKEAAPEAAKEAAPEAAKECKCGEKDCSCDKKTKEDAKEAAGPQLELTTDVLAKIAALVMATEEGAEFVETKLAEAAGAEAAQETLSFLAEQSELAEKQAAYEQGQADAEALITQAIYAAGIEAGEKKAADAQNATLYTKLGQEAADAGIAELMGAGGGAPDMGAEALGADPAAAEMGAAEEMGAGEEEGITEEELQEALAALVEEGTITPEDASQVIDYISQGGEAEMAGAEAVPEEAIPEEAPAEAGAEAGADAGMMEAQASDKASALLAAIRAIRNK